MIKQTNTDLMITFKYVNVDVDILEDIYDEDDIKKITNAISVFSREITIDKSYVSYKGTKYEKVFLTEHGWKYLCNILVKTNYGKKATKKQYHFLETTYCMMIITYLYMCLEDIGYSSEGIYIGINSSRLLCMVEIKKDTYLEYERYPGKWQLWNS